MENTKIVSCFDVAKELRNGLYQLIRVRKNEADFDATVYPMLKTIFFFNTMSRYQNTVEVKGVQYRLEDYQVTKGINDLILPKIIVVRDAPGYMNFKDGNYFIGDFQYENDKGEMIHAELLTPSELAVNIKQLGGWMRINAALVPLHVEDVGLITEYVKYAIYSDGAVEERTQPAIVKLTQQIDEFNSESYKEWAYTKAQFLIHDGGGGNA